MFVRKTNVSVDQMRQVARTLIAKHVRKEDPLQGQRILYDNGSSYLPIAFAFETSPDESFFFEGQDRFFNDVISQYFHDKNHLILLLFSFYNPLLYPSYNYDGLRMVSVLWRYGCIDDVLSERHLLYDDAIILYLADALEEMDLAVNEAIQEILG